MVLVETPTSEPSAEISKETSKVGCGASTSLTPEQLQRIEENKRKAVEKRQRALLARSASASSTVSQESRPVNRTPVLTAPADYDSEAEAESRANNEVESLGSASNSNNIEDSYQADAGGGFFADDDDIDVGVDGGGLSKVEGESKQPLATERPTSSVCVKCGALTVVGCILQTFDVAICKACRRGDPEYELIMKTKAKEEFFLNDTDMKDMPYIERKNPNRSNWTMMKLYLRRTVREAAIAKHGSKEALEQKLVQRREDQWKRSSKKMKAALKRKAAEAAVLAPPKRTGRVALAVDEDHSHSFREEFMEDMQKWFRICDGCGMKIEFEKF